MKPVHPHLGYHARRAFMLLYFALAAVLPACQSSPRPGEVTITGGTATASQRSYTGYGLEVSPAPPAPPPQAPQTPWMIILDPLPSDPKAAKEALTAPPVPLPESP